MEINATAKEMKFSKKNKTRPCIVKRDGVEALAAVIRIMGNFFSFIGLLSACLTIHEAACRFRDNETT